MSIDRERLHSGPRMVLTRHQQCRVGEEGRFNGLLDLPLSLASMERRFDTANELLKAFGVGGITAVLSSWMLRARMTAEPLAGAIGQGDVLLLPNFQERKLGQITGLTPSQAKKLFRPEDLVRTRHTVYAFSKSHGMETDTATTARVLGVLNLVSSMYEPNDTVVLFGHGDAIRGGMAGYLGVPMISPEVLDVPIGYGESVVLDGGKVEKLVT